MKFILGESFPLLLGFYETSFVSMKEKVDKQEVEDKSNKNAQTGLPQTDKGNRPSYTKEQTQRSLRLEKK